MENENLLDEETVETDLENDNDEMELDDIDLLQMQEEEEDYKAKYEKLFAENTKLRKAFVAQKKASKQSKHDDRDDIDARLDARLEMREFYKNNPDATENKEKIEDYVKKGISREDAYYLLSRDTTEAKKTSASRTVGRSRINTGFKKISSSEFYKMSPKAQDDYIQHCIGEYGELSFE